MRELPSGTVTFLFTDIEGSTRLLDELGEERYEAALATHREQLRAAFGCHGGVEVDTQGDAFFYAFSDARAAVAAADEGRRVLGTGPIRVRMGLHTGEARLSDDGYVGHEVHRGARVAALGHGGQVLLSHATRERVDGDMTELGEHRLKDFAQPLAIYQLGSERFPPLKSISNTNLPRPASSFVGRESDVREVAELLKLGHRVVTLTGPGGSGKTRLAIETASELVPQFKAGVFWTSLAPLRDPALVLETIAQTLGAQDGLAEHIGGRELLLLLDNLEQVIDAAPALAELAERCPNLRLLVTSRELLRVRGEVEFAVAPLAEPDAVALFCDRSRSEPNAAIAELCRRLDQLPLAVELAAARARVLTPEQMLERLSQRLDLLKGGRDADARQRTLRATIEWSYDLLGADEQVLFGRLSVFAGGCTLPASEAVADADLDTLQSLVEKSLVRQSGDRFWMLETIREYALERLAAADEIGMVAARHAQWFLALAEEAEPQIYRESNLGESEALDHLERELDNLRAALDWFDVQGDNESALRLSAALNDFWCLKRHVGEGRRYLERALAADGGQAPGRAKALVAAAHMARDSGDAAAARARAEEGLALQRHAGDAWGTAQALFWLAQALADQRDFSHAAELHEEASLLFTEAGDEHAALGASRMLTWTLSELGDKERARALSEENLQRAIALGNRPLEASVLGGLTSRAVEENRLGDAASLALRTMRVLSGLDGAAGTPSDDRNVPVALCRCAAALALAGEAEDATRLLACSEALHEEIGVQPLPYLAAENEQTLARLRDHVECATFEELWEQGRKLRVDEGVELALEKLGAVEATARKGL